MVCMDSGCSISVTPSLDDFEAPPFRGDFGTMQSVQGTAKIQAFGFVRWRVTDTKGSSHILRCPAYYIPEANLRLMSPQDYARFHGWKGDDGCFHGHDRKMWIKLALVDAKDIRTLDAPVSKIDNLPYFDATLDNCKDGSTTQCSCKSNCARCNNAQLFDSALEASGFSMEVLNKTNENLTAAQKELLLDHQRLGHIGFEHLQSLYRDRELVCEFDGCSKTSGACLVPKHRGTGTCEIPLCLACQACKAKRRTAGTAHSKKDEDRDGILKADTLQPGERVFVDHYESDTRARLPNTRGREREHNQYKGGTIFHDAATGLIKVYHQVTFTAEETIKSKHRFEADVAQCGVTVQKYRTDNGRDFTSYKWEQELEQNKQTPTFSGVGAQHQNALAERSIQTVCNMARTMLLHLQIHWPDEYDTKLWGFALDYAVWLWNHTPCKDNGLAPIEIFCGTKTSCEYLRRAKVFGAPVYVLDHRLQNGNKIPKWKPRARRGMFLGFSPHHSSSVGLILNLQTGTISPQFHYIIDSKFTTVPGGLSGRSTSEITQDDLHIWLTSQWDTPEREFTLDDWDESIDGALPPTLWDEHPPPVDGHNLPDPDNPPGRHVTWDLPDDEDEGDYDFQTPPPRQTPPPPPPPDPDPTTTTSSQDPAEHFRFSYTITCGWDITWYPAS